MSEMARDLSAGPANERVIVAMSGGVDSSVAAARLVDAGYDVVGVTLHLWDYPDDAPEKSRCCAPEDAHDARRVADHLGFPHYTFDRRSLFAERVVDPFVDAYLEGRTPSPCVDCNRTVKMRELFGIADRLGARLLSTGHYARVETDGEGGGRLLKGRDGHKDQSYFLHMLRSAEIARLVLPLGDSLKQEVRDEAIARDLPGAHKGESQELCFVASGDYGGFVADRAPDRVRPGAIVDGDGRRLGEHDGVHRFTIGQRRGLGVALGKPAFVSKIDHARAEVQVGDAASILAAGAVLSPGDWQDDVRFPIDAHVKVRSRTPAAPATIAEERDADGATRLVARFVDPLRAVAPGQIAVAYEGDRVLGGATILAALEASA